MLTHQIEQGRFNCRHCMDGHAQIECLFATTTGVARGKSRLDGVENSVAGADRLADDKLARVLERLANCLAAGDFANADMTGVVGQQHDVAGEERRMRAAEIEQHAVASGNGYDLHIRHDGRARKTGANGVLNHVILPANE